MFFKNSRPRLSLKPIDGLIPPCTGWARLIPQQLLREAAAWGYRKAVEDQMALEGVTSHEKQADRLASQITCLRALNQIKALHSLSDDYCGYVVNEGYHG